MRQDCSHRGTETQSCQRMALRAKHGSMERKYPSIGATAPIFGSCRGCAMRILRRGCRRTEASFMRHQPSHTACGRSPADWEGRIAAWEILGIEVERMEVCCAWASKNFPSPPEAVPNLVRRGEAIRHGRGRMGLVPMRRRQGRWLAKRDGAPVSQFRRGSALCTSAAGLSPKNGGINCPPISETRMDTGFGRSCRM